MTKKEEELIKRLRNSVRLAKECGKSITKEFKNTDNYVREIPIVEEKNNYLEIADHGNCNCQKDECCCGKANKPSEPEVTDIFKYPKDTLFGDYGIRLVDEEGYGYEFNDYLTGFGFIKGRNEAGKERVTLELEYTFDVKIRWIPSIDDLNILERIPTGLLYNTVEEPKDNNLTIHYRDYIVLMKDAKVLNVRTNYLGEGKRKIKIMLTKNYDNEE